MTGSFANGCTSTADITITEDVTNPNVVITNNETSSATTVTCVNTEISVTASGADSIHGLMDHQPLQLETSLLQQPIL